VKILLNAVVSKNANWPTFDFKDLYLGTTLDAPEYSHGWGMPAHPVLSLQRPALEWALADLGRDE